MKGLPADTDASSSPERTETTGGWWPLVAIVLAVSMLMLDGTVVIVALPDIQDSLHTTLRDSQWVLNAFTLALASFQLAVGFLGDRFGRRRMFLGGVLLFGAASVACGLAWSPEFLIAARAVQGASGAAIFSMTMALIAQCYTGKARGTAFGVRGGVAGAMVVLSPLLGGVIVSSLGWRWIFFINVPIVAAVVVIGWFNIPEQLELRKVQRFDGGGLSTLTAGLLLLTYVLLSGDDYGWTSNKVVVLLTAAVACLAAFLFIEARHPDPMLDLSLFRGRSFTGTQLATLCTNASFFGLLVYLSLYLQNQLGYSALKAGLCFLAANVPILLAGPIAGSLMDRLPARVLPTLGLMLVGVGMILMYGITTDSTVKALIPGLIAVGFGLGIALPSLGALAMEVADSRRLGMAAGINSTVGQAGMTISIAVYGALLEHQVSTTMSDRLDGGLPVRELANAAAGGDIAQSVGQLSGAVRAQVVSAAREGFVAGMNLLFLVVAGVAFVGAVLTVTLVRLRARATDN
ncbi:MFS transporter [Streptomyces iranensis]|uniref:Drug resistance transporter, EmrB/QacAsubfamily n=1 Tax=Streptomyces iranensis TaxID=576784 RepID=A0A060ZSF4_9ACTN|nr:MFS transporter [Streptomyces iranensis]MBP2060855.1 EmrB/QacA subfamily drug resistance transporter [Streptomyces iranensis]CDR06316.1 drug resistance transporter, EmrB/QacAsubfamily [Streptomyces iranensis]